MFLASCPDAVRFCNFQNCQAIVGNPDLMAPCSQKQSQAVGLISVVIGNDHAVCVWVSPFTALVLGRHDLSILPDLQGKLYIARLRIKGPRAICV
jgi:hypothetical protein